MPVVATAGHVDHGKSTLVQALTGRDPDRWEEEKRRGMTIDLGFAWTALPSGKVVSFVDVPGHRRFIGNMLAGVGPVTVALLVVAADEGWMAQTEEHLAALDALGVERAVVALTKIDRVDPDRVAAQLVEVEHRLERTGLAQARVIAVSAVTGEGLSDLRIALDSALGNNDLRGNRPRMWVDRVFSVSGSGTVVTGTLTDGSLAVGDVVSVWPGYPRVRIRALQSNEQDHDRVDPVSRVAVNLVGVEREGLGRGAMLSAPGSFLPTSRLLATLRPARYESELAERGAYLFHVGTFSATVRLNLLDQGLALLELGEPACLASGDRFVIRDTGRQLVVAGGAVLDPAPPSLRRDVTAIGSELGDESATGPDRIATVLLEHRQRELLPTLAAHSGGGTPLGAISADGQAISAAEAGRLAEAASQSVAAFHNTNRLEEGIGLSQLAAQLGISPGLLKAVIAGTELRLHGSVVVGSDDRAELETDPRWARAHRILQEAGLAPPLLKELGLEGELLRALIRDGRLVRISDDLVYLTDDSENLKRLLHEMGGSFSVSEFRQKAGISRKYAVPFLEWADRESITVRSGDLRSVRSPNPS